MGLKGKIEAIIYAAEEPITLEQVAFLMKEPVLQEIVVEQERAVEEAAAREQSTETATDIPITAAEDVASKGADEAPTPTAGELPAAQSGENAEAETAEASESAKPAVASRRKKNEVPTEVRARVKAIVLELIDEYANNDRGMEIRHVAGGYRMATKPEHHDIVKAFAKSLKPPLRLSLPALETLAVVAYKQPVTAPEVSDIRGVDSQGVMATLLERKLVTTAGRKAVIGRPILYKTTKEFLLRFGLNEVSELPSMEEFEKLAMEQSGLFLGESEAEPALTPEEASARLEEVSAAEEAASDATDENSAEAPIEEEAVNAPAAPEDERHQS